MKPYKRQDGLVNATAWGLVGIGLLMAALASSNCSNPISASENYKPQHNNIPATFKGQEFGPMVWLCATQPRQYDVNGHSQMEEDHYLQYEPCPAELVK